MIKKTYKNSFLNLSVNTNKQEILDLIDSLLDFTEPVNSNSQININFNFSFEENDLVLFSHHELNPKGIYQIYGGQEHATAYVNFETQEVKALIYKYNNEIKEHILETIFMRPLRSILAHHNLYYIHCGLIIKDKDCVMIVGQSGSGKSTIGVSSTKFGYKIATDDNLFLKIEDNKIKYFPLCTKIGANIHFINRFPDLRTQIGFTYGNKARVSIKELPHTDTPANYNCKAILFPTFELGGKLSLTRLSKPEVIRKLSEQSLQRYPEGALKEKLTPGNFWLLNKISDQDNSYIVSYGENDISNIFDLIN